MNHFLQILQRPLSTPSMDRLVARWVLTLSGLVIVGAVAVGLTRYAARPAEMAVGMALAALTCLLLSLFGVLAARAEDRPHRQRIAEYVCYGLALALLASGLWGLSTVGLTRVGLILGLLGLIDATMFLLCLGAHFSKPLAKCPAGPPH